MAFSGNCGLGIYLKGDASALELLFSEELGLVLEVPRGKADQVVSLLTERQVDCLTIGWTGSDPGATETSKALKLARAADLTIVISEHLGSFPRQRTLLQRLLDSGQRVVVVYAGSPYDASWFPSARAQVATYSDVPVSMRGLARVITGETRATGSSSSGCNNCSSCCSQ